VVLTVKWIDTDGNAAGGNEQCQYDKASQSFLVNNDATLANPHGEVDVIPAATVLAQPSGSTANFLALAGLKRYPLGNCDPTGMDLGPGVEMAVECRQGDKGVALTTLILNRNTGAIVATVPIGGGDQLAYDARTNRYYVAGSRWHASGVNDQGGGCAAANPCTPVLAVIDATTHAIVSTYATGNNAHSVAVDPQRGFVFVPYSSATAPAGCATCAANGFVNGGISVFAL
jgi:DNA-binding beta-propeller fold protein YncE